jgi:putative oxidoreductase
MGFFTKTMGIPAPLAFLAIAAEFAGPVALALGLFGRVAALAIATVMVVAAMTTHVSNGFFMNWFGNQKGEGFEFHILALAIAAAIIIGGSGAFSIDYHLFRML